jgi:formylglycine-generating enzyme required for sulfatase activity
MVMKKACVVGTVALLLTLPWAGALADGAAPWTREGTAAGQEIIGPDGGTYVWVPAGEFTMGTADEEAAAAVKKLGAMELRLKNERPAHKVRITRGFWLGKCEVTAAQFARFVTLYGREADKDNHPLLHRSDAALDVRGMGWRFRARAPAGRGKHPVVEVTWYGAKTYCGYYGLALPTEAEWEYAARGQEGRVFPWGNEWEARNCCNAANRGPEGTTFAVGSAPAGASWCGALDMAGNAWECCADWYDGGYYAKSPAEDPPGPATGGARVLRGGSCVDLPDHCRSADRSWFVPGETCSNNGFRACVHPVGR